MEPENFGLVLPFIYPDLRPDDFLEKLLKDESPALPIVYTKKEVKAIEDRIQSRFEILLEFLPGRAVGVGATFRTVSEHLTCFYSLFDEIETKTHEIIQTIADSKCMSPDLWEPIRLKAVQKFDDTVSKDATEALSKFKDISNWCSHFFGRAVLITDQIAECRNTIYITKYQRIQLLQLQVKFLPSDVQLLTLHRRYTFARRKFEVYLTREISDVCRNVYLPPNIQSLAGFLTPSDDS